MSLSSAKLNTTFYFNAVTTNPSGGNIQNCDVNPTFWVFNQNSDTPVIANSGLTLRSGWIGLYRGEFPITSPNFSVQNTYSIIVSGQVNGVPGLNQAGLLFVENNSLDNLMPSGVTVNATVTSISSGSIADIWGQQVDELTSVPQFPITYGQMFMWMYERSHNKTATTASGDYIYKTDGVTILGSGQLTDDGTTFTRYGYTN